MTISCAIGPDVEIEFIGIGRTGWLLPALIAGLCAAAGLTPGGPGAAGSAASTPDAWETEVIDTHLLGADWPEGDVFHQVAEVSGRDAYRVLVPEYYSEGCLSCHGGPAGQIDVTGYPMEGGALGDLGGVISITLFDAE